VIDLKSGVYLYHIFHSSLRAFVIQTVGHECESSRFAKSSSMALRSTGSDMSGPHIKMVWQRVMRLDTFAGEDEHAPHIALA
jgi:hypothetical protein